MLPARMAVPPMTRLPASIAHHMPSPKLGDRTNATQSAPGTNPATTLSPSGQPPICCRRRICLLGGGVRVRSDPPRSTSTEPIAARTLDVRQVARLVRSATSDGADASVRSALGLRRVTAVQQLIPGLGGVGEAGVDVVAVALGGAGVDVAGEVGDLDEVVELVADE